MATILVVEDEAGVQLSLRAAIEEAGHSVVEATTGNGGLQAVAGEPIDLAIVDVGLPDVDGIQLLKEMRDKHATIPVIVISGGRPGMVLEEKLALAEAYGALSTLIKPFDDDALLEAMNSALAVVQARV